MKKKLYTLPEDERICKRCGSPLVSMGKEKIRTEVQFIPAQVKIIDIYRESFQCLECRKQEHFVVEKPQMPHSVLQNSMATASAVAHVIVQKYQMAAPPAGTGMEEYRPAPFPGNHGQLDHPVFPGLAVSPGQCHEG